MYLLKFIVVIIVGIQIGLMLIIWRSYCKETAWSPTITDNKIYVVSFFNEITGEFEFPEEYFQKVLTADPFLLSANNETGFPDYVVPNYVHFIRIKQPNITFVDLICLLAVYRNQKPERIFIHCDDCNFQGSYWKQAKELIPVLKINHFIPPIKIYGIKFSDKFGKWHAGDVARIQILQKHGGIFLDNDVYVVQSLDRFRKFEMTLDWDEGQNKGTQVLIAHPKARYLELWKQTYLNYRGDLWYYNAGQLPTKAILKKHPEIIHRVKELFGVRLRTSGFLYVKDNPDWKTFYTYHLLLRWVKDLIPAHIKEFNEFNIRNYNRTFGRMARLMYYGSEDLIPDFNKTELPSISKQATLLKTTEKIKTSTSISRK